MGTPVSARNRLENKRARADRRIAKKAANMLDGVAQPTAKIGVCVVTGKRTVVDLEHSISQPAWFAIQRYVVMSEIDNRLKDKGLQGAVPADRVLEILQDDVARV